MHAYPHVPHGDNHSMFGRRDVDLNSCIPTLGYLPASAAVRQISAAKAPHRVIGPLVHHALPWGRMHSFSLCLSYLLLVPRVGGWAPNFFFSLQSLSSWRSGAQAASKGGASDRCLSIYAGVRPPRASRTPFPFVPPGLLPSTSSDRHLVPRCLDVPCSRPVLLPPSCAWLAAFDVHRSVTWLLR